MSNPLENLPDKALVERLIITTANQINAIVQNDPDFLLHAANEQQYIKELILQRMKQATTKQLFSHNETLDIMCAFNNMQFAMSQFNQRISAYMAKTDTEAVSSVKPVEPPSPVANA